MASLTNTKIKNTYVSLLKVADNGQLDAALQDITDGAGNVSGIQLNTGGDLTASGTISFGSLKDSGENITITKFVDAADGIGSNDNDTTIPTSAAVKLYVDTNITAQDLDFTTDSGTGAVDLDSQTFSILGTANEIETSGTGQTVTIGLPSSITVDVTGNLTGNVSGNVTGNVTGNLSGNVTGNVTGDLTGNVTATSVLVDGVTATTQLSSDNSTKVATTAFVKSVVTAEGLDFAGDSGTGTIDLDSETLTIAGTANEIETSATGNTLTVGLPSNVTIGNDLTVTTNASVGGTFGVTGTTTLTGDLAVDTDTLFVDVSEDRVGINKPVPTVALDVVGDITSSATITGTTLAGTLSTAAQPNITSVGTLSSLAVSGNLTVDTDTLYVDSANNRVGIGTSSPSVNLSVQGASTAGFVTPLSISNPSTNAASSVKLALAAGGTTWGEIGASYNTNDPYMAFFVRSGSEKMRITDAGNVGIGNVGSNAKLEVYASSGEVFRADASAGAYRIVANQSGVNLNGNVGIGTSSPTAKLHVNIGTDQNIAFNSLSGVARISSFNDAVTLNKPLVINGEDIRFTADGTEKGRFTTDGLTFNGDTAAANALDDYEEGTWTMGISFGGASAGVTYAGNTGRYTKIGRQVNVQGYLDLSNKGSSTGNCYLTGLPFTVSAGNYATGSIRVGNTTYVGYPIIYAEPNTTTIAVQEVSEAGAVSFITEADVTNTSNFMISLTYTI